MSPLYLVDGSGYIFRAFFAIAPLSNSKGLPTNAIFGYTRMLVKLLKDVKPEFIAVAFDTGEPTFRHEKYDQYKANRAECPEELVPQMPYFRSVSQALGLAVLEQVGVEADDIIGTLVKRFDDGERKIIIISGDKDLTQLVNDNVEVWDPMRDVHFTPARVREKFGVNPDQIIDYLSLIGDSSDNVPGIKGVGPKTAEQLITHFGSLEAMLARPAGVLEIRGLRGAASVQAKLEAAHEMALLSKELITLRTDVEPYYSGNINAFTGLEQYRWHGTLPELCEPLLRELEFSNLVDALPSAGGPTSMDREISSSAKQFHLVTSDTFDEFVRVLAEQKRFAIDTETTDLDPLKAELVGISLSWQAGEGYFIPALSASQPDAVIPLERVRAALAPILADPNRKKVGLNLKFDARVLETQLMPLAGIAFDVMLASYVLHPDGRQHNLAALTAQHLSEQMVKYEDLVPKGENISVVPLEDLKNYACHDAEAAWRLTEIFEKLLGPVTDAPSCRKVFEEVEMPVLPVLVSIEQTGVRVDPAVLSRMSEKFATELVELEHGIHELAGGEFNINSPKQLSEVLFERLGIPTAGVKRTQTNFSTDASVLQKLEHKHPIIRKLIEYRELFKLKSTYIDALPELINPRTGRIHASFNQAVAATGRLSSSDPNLQNIPIRGERGRAIREAFVAAEGNVLISADYSQIELRILAHMSSDQNLCEAFRSGDDIHSRTAVEIFGPFSGSDAERADQRRIAKTINFGIIYGMGASRLASSLTIPRAQAQRYIDEYFARYSGVRRYFDELASQIESQGFVETLFGRKRYLSEVNTAGRDPSYGVRALQNFPLQGTAAEIMKVAMTRLFNQLKVMPGPAIILQVHDELVVESPRALAAEVESLVETAMASAVTLSVPLGVETRVGESWGKG